MPGQIDVALVLATTTGTLGQFFFFTTCGPILNHILASLADCGCNNVVRFVCMWGDWAPELRIPTQSQNRFQASSWLVVFDNLLPSGGVDRICVGCTCMAFSPKS